MGESRKVLNLVIQSVTVGAVEMFGGGAAAWRTIAFIYCIIGIITNTLAVFSVKELSDEELKEVVESTNVFAKLAPEQKSRVVSMLRINGHVVGFMGDGINDAPAVRKSDVGISVDTGVDIAKESADIILLEKDLMVLENGI